MENLEKNWTALKEILWFPFPDKQVAIDEYENLLVMKNDNGLIDVIAYGHITGEYLFQSGLIKFIEDVKDICRNNGWDSGVIKFIINFPLSKVKYLSSLKRFPIDVEYYHFNAIQLGHTAPVLQSLQGEIQSLVDRIKHIKEEKEDRDVVDEEYNIMKALISGDGELYGF